MRGNACIIVAMKTSSLIFEYLDKAREDAGITDIAWAKKSGIRRPTIPEMRSRAKSLRIGPPLKGRPITIKKVTFLHAGLSRLTGGDELKKKIFDLIADEKDQMVRMMMLLMAAQGADKEELDHLEKSIELIAKKSSGFRGRLCRENQ